MKSAVLIFPVLILYSSNITAQLEKEKIDKWIGAWEGTFEIGGYKNVEVLENRWIHNDKFFKIELKGHLADDPEMKYSSTTFYTSDGDGNIFGWRFDDNGYDAVTTFKGKMDNNKIILTGKSKDFTLKETCELKDNKILRKSECKYGNKDPIVIEVTYYKK